ncbi:unnamed protein product, partial [Laminaria digitata]
MAENLRNIFVPILFPAILYYAGYSYIDGYYEYFDISLREINPNLQEIIAHGAGFYINALISL